MKAYLQFIRIALLAVTFSIGLTVSLFVLSNNSVLAADGKLSNQQAKQLISELFNKQPDKLEVIGVFQPQENVAQADVAITNLAIAIPKNDAVTAYAFGPGGGTRIWSGRGKANFMRYNDGAWVITTLDTDAGSFSPKSLQPAAPAQQPQAAPQQQQPGLASGQTGKVLSTIDTPGYIYIEVEQNDKTVWVATRRPVAAKKGDIIRFNEIQVWTNYKSNALGRTFPTISLVKIVSNQ